MHKLRAALIHHSFPSRSFTQAAKLSFDNVPEINSKEVENAVNHAKQKLANRPPRIRARSTDAVETAANRHK